MSIPSLGYGDWDMLTRAFRKNSWRAAFLDVYPARWMCVGSTNAMAENMTAYIKSRLTEEWPLLSAMACRKGGRSRTGR